MIRLNRDTIIAVVVLAFCGATFLQTLTVKKTVYESIGSEVWPQIVLAIFTVLTMVYLWQSVRAGPDATTGRRFSPIAFVVKYQNAFWCYAMFLVFLLLLPGLGMLLDGALFVFLTLTAIGNRKPRDLVLHAAIAIGAVGFMWTVFTFAIRVILPVGEWTNI